MTSPGCAHGSPRVHFVTARPGVAGTLAAELVAPPPVVLVIGVGHNHRLWNSGSSQTGWAAAGRKPAARLVAMLFPEKNALPLPKIYSVG